ncbi:CHAP domain-containing protein [Bifidobacterium castoris]|uniref:Surface antigen n=1 Tax=Bifidobacterium castoris TaxID=2306972 RepID=A0A430FA90_9BIFI|nr:CHAP domain-containing protein [Bifidobacterium castoris]RSX49757.1 surface antigen [Bifidobacterium castoris]
MSAAHAKPLSRRRRRRRECAARRAVGAVFLMLLGAASCGLVMSGTAGATGASHGHSPVTRVTQAAAADRSQTRADLFADNAHAASVDATGTWKLSDDRIDVDALTTPKPAPAAGEPSDTAASPAAGQTRASEQTVALLNDTAKPDAARTGTPADTGDTGNAYPWGQCTWWAYERRHQLGLPAGSHFGNAASWAASAAALGYTVDTTPTVGAIVVFQPGQAGAHPVYGHVAVVEQIHDDGSVTISESNVQGLGVISNRTLPAASQYAYIH